MHITPEKGAKATEDTPILAWHFLPEDKRLRYGDNRLVEVGQTYSYEGETNLTICEKGMHASVKAIDALGYAPGPIICRVEVWGDLVVSNNKIKGRHRKVLAMADASRTLHEFAVAQAEGALKLAGVTDERCWAALRAKVDWLDGKITDDDLARAGDAAWAAAGDAAWAATRDATRAAAEAAARDATRAATEAAARDATRAATNKDLEERFNSLLHPN